MKKAIFILLVTFAGTFVFGQYVTEFAEAGNNVFTSISSSEEELVVGDPYYDENFYPATISGVKGTVDVRYNAYADRFEFYSGEKLMYLDYNRVPPRIEVGNKLYEFTSYNEGKSYNEGYLQVLNEGEKITLYKRMWIKKLEGKSAETSYQTDQPARYSPQSDQYYVKFSNELINPVETKKKKFRKMFNSVNPKAVEFIKSNKISPKSEVDLMKLAEYLNEN